MKADCILLVDDDHISNYINTKLFAKLNISKQVVVRRHGGEAFKYLKEYCSDVKNTGVVLVFLDLMMPVIDGFEFIKKVNELEFTNKDKIKINILTDFASYFNTERLKRAGANSILQKPLTYKKIKEIIQKN